jgi:hypothetical protein
MDLGIGLGVVGRLDAVSEAAGVDPETESFEEIWSNVVDLDN